MSYFENISIEIIFVIFNNKIQFIWFTGDSLHCPPLDRAYKSKPLAHYPEHVSWNPFDAHGICMLSLPQGLRFRTQKHSIEPHLHSFATTVRNYIDANFQFTIQFILHKSFFHPLIFTK